NLSQRAQRGRRIPAPSSRLRSRRRTLPRLQATRDRADRAGPAVYLFLPPLPADEAGEPAASAGASPLTCFGAERRALPGIANHRFFGYSRNLKKFALGRLVKLADTQDLGSCAERRRGSSP